MDLIRGMGQQSEIMIVTDYCSKNDRIAGHVLAGKAGGAVSNYLKDIGVTGGLDYCYRTAYIKAVLEGVETTNTDKRREIIEEALKQFDYASLLQREIETIKPNVIISLGELSLNILTKEKGIYDFRGSILPIRPDWKLPFTPKVIPTFHPRQIWENYPAHYYVPIDYKRAWDLRHMKGPYKRKELLWIAKSANDIYQYWQRAKEGEFLVFDIETYLNFVTCIGFCADGYESVCVPMLENLSPQEMKLTWSMVREILASNIPKVNQNIGFDEYQVEKYGFKVNNILDDTMLLFHHIYSELPKRLGFQTSVYTDQPYYKDEGKGFDPRNGLDQLYFYNAKDSLVTWQIYKAQVKDAKEIKVFGFHRDNFWNNNLFHIYSRMGRRGIQVDPIRQGKLRRKYEMLFNGHKNSIEQAYGKEININSWQQVAKFVYDYLGCPPMTHVTKSGDDAPNTDAESLEELCINKITDQRVRSLVKEVILCRKIDTILEYINKPLHPDGRLRYTYRLEGTKSGRTSGSPSQDSIFVLIEGETARAKSKIVRRELGATPHNIPKRTYECEEFEGEIYGSDIPSMFVPSPGYCFVEGDGKSAEAGVVFVLAEDWDMLDYMYNRKATKKNKYGIKDDIHTLTAMMARGITFEEVTKFARENYGKRARHAGHFDMGPFRLMLMIHRPLSECKSVLERFHLKNPKIRLIFHGDIKRYVENNGFLDTPQGRRRYFLNRRTGKQFWKEVYSHYSQATVSDHTKFTMPLILGDVPTAEFLIEKHDSLLAEVPIAERERYCVSFKKHYERKIDFRNGSIARNHQLVIPAEILVGDEGESWGNLKEWEG